MQYNSAGYIEGPDANGVIRLRKTKEDACLIARVPKECIIEFMAPCRTYQAAGPSAELEREVRSLRKEIRSLARKLGKV